MIPSTFYPNSESDFEIFMYIPENEASSVVFKPILEVEEVEEEEEEPEPEPEPEVEPEPEPEVQPEPEPEAQPEEVATPETTQDSEEIQQYQYKISTLEGQLEVAQNRILELQNQLDQSKKQSDVEIRKEEPKAESSSDNSTPPPPPPANVPAPPKKRTVTKASAAPAKTKRAATDGDIFQQIQAGSFLRKVAPEEKTSYAQRARMERLQGWNMDKIVARRSALEISDDEEEDWSDHEDDDDWW